MRILLVGQMMFVLVELGHESLQKLYSNLDRIDFTQEFLDRYAPIQDPHIKKIRSKIQKNLISKLNAGLKTKFSSIPWRFIKREDLVNWPNDVPLNNIDKLGIEHLWSLYENLDLINFTQEFFDCYASKDKDGLKDKLIQEFKDRNGNSWSNGRDELRSKLAIYLGNKLASRLEVADIRHIRIPWGKLKENDIINWPKNVKIGPLSSLPINGLLALNELAKKDELNFSSEFLDFIRESLKKHKN